jgi:hypothetical protein
MFVVMLCKLSAVTENSEWLMHNGLLRKTVGQFMTIVNPPKPDLMETFMQHTAPTYVVSNIVWGGCHNLSGIPDAVDIV